MGFFGLNKNTSPWLGMNYLLISYGFNRLFFVKIYVYFIVY